MRQKKKLNLVDQFIGTSLNIVESMLLKLFNIGDSHSTLYFPKTTFNDFYLFDTLSTKIPLQQIYIYF
jgi:hypothetical protein